MKIKRADQILPEVYGTTLNNKFSWFFFIGIIKPHHYLTGEAMNKYQKHEFKMSTNISLFVAPRKFIPTKINDHSKHNPTIKKV